MVIKIHDKGIEESGDLEFAIKSLNQLCLGSIESSAAVKTDQPVGNLPKNGAEWVELLVNEMQCSSDIDDAKARASKVLQVLEKTIHTQVIGENAMLKEQNQVLIHENGILKRAVAIQYERQKEANNKSSTELQQLVDQYQERVRTLEVNNYVLAMHLKQSQGSNFMPGCFSPDVF